MQELKSIDFVKQLAPLQINLIFLSISMFSVYDEKLLIANSLSSVSLQKMKRRSAGLICRCFLSFGVSVVILMMKETRLRRQIRSKMYAFEADFKKKCCYFRTSCPPFGSAPLILFLFFFFFIVAHTCIPSAETRVCTVVQLTAHLFALYMFCPWARAHRYRCLPLQKTNFKESIFYFSQIIFWRWLSSDMLCVCVVFF